MKITIVAGPSIGCLHNSRKPFLRLAASRGAYCLGSRSFVAMRFFLQRKNFTPGCYLPPPAVIGDITYGLSDKFSVGVVGGTTGALALYGIRVNVRLYQKNDFRLVYRMISVYYSERNGTFLFDSQEKYVMPWMLSMGWSMLSGKAQTECGGHWERVQLKLTAWPE